MRRFKHELEQEISAVFSNFLREQLGEHATSIQTFLSGNMLTVRALNSLAPGEQQLAHNHQHWKLLQETKTREFNQVESLLREMLEKVTGRQVQNVYSMFDQDGVRFAVVTFSDKLEKKFLKVKEMEP